MGFLNFSFIWHRPVDPLPRQELERTLRDYDQKLRELKEAIDALRSEHDPSTSSGQVEPVDDRRH
jgi:sugar-specific transcriptional regulator TrmB